MFTFEQLIARYDPTLNPATILRGTGRWETEGPSLLATAAALVFGANVPVDISAGTNLSITLTSNAAFQFTNATGPAAPALVLLRISNTAGVPHGAGTFDTKWKVAGNVDVIATGFNRSMLFYWNGVDTMFEIVRGPTDIPN